MAEERLIDTDKDKKYRFRINEDGEEELVIDDGLSEEESAPADEICFEVPEDAYDDEEAAVMTPEQLAEKRRRAEQAEEERKAKLASLISAANGDYSVGNYATALENALGAEELSPEDGEIHALKLLIYTRGFTSYEGTLDKAEETAEDVKTYCTPERRAELFAQAEDSLNQNISALSQRVEKLSEENEAKKAERAVRFNADNNKARICFGAVAAPFVVFLALTISFAMNMFANQSGTFIVLTIVFAALAFINLIALVFVARRWNITARRVRMNKNNTKTQLGREYLAEKNKLDLFNAIYSALKD
ncbi:MAG: hypothetical protein ACI4MH_05715 [Candidatus Coproplasma sp.]